MAFHSKYVSNARSTLSIWRFRSNRWDSARLIFNDLRAGLNFRVWSSVSRTGRRFGWIISIGYSHEVYLIKHPIAEISCQMSESFKLSVLYGMESMLNTVESTALRRGSMERMGAVCKLIIFYTVHENGRDDDRTRQVGQIHSVRIRNSLDWSAKASLLEQSGFTNGESPYLHQ